MGTHSVLGLRRQQVPATLRIRTTPTDRHGTVEPYHLVNQGVRLCLGLVPRAKGHVGGVIQLHVNREDNLPLADREQVQILQKKKTEQ